MLESLALSNILGYILYKNVKLYLEFAKVMGHLKIAKVTGKSLRLGTAIFIRHPW